MRAAFKAATDGKQTAVLVPTTVLALQHYNSFKERFKDFPVRVEYLSRGKSPKETKDILADLNYLACKLVADDGRILGDVVGDAFVGRTLVGSLVGGHADAVADHLGQDLIFLDLRELELFEPQVIHAVEAYCFGFHERMVVIGYLLLSGAAGVPGSGL